MGGETLVGEEAIALKRAADTSDAPRI